VQSFRGGNLETETFNPLIAASVNENRLVVNIDGNEYDNSKYDIYMDNNLNIMVPVNLLSDGLNCSAHLYPDETLLLEKRDDAVSLSTGTETIEVNGESVSAVEPFIKSDGGYYVSIADVTTHLGYNYFWDINENGASAFDASGQTSILPSKYDLREKGRTSIVRNQGNSGTCWAFASLASLESDLLPTQQYEFSVDHMSRENSFSLDQNLGGEYTMAMAYLLAWQGPVYEAEDPFGDGESPQGLSPEKHVQEIQLVEGKDYEKIKESVFKYGGVQTSLYCTIYGNYEPGEHYNPDEYAYCYIGTEKPNHEVVIVGWDDNYSKDNFVTEVEGDGAFICQNSWGEEFGDNGYFYVSYYDTNIGSHNVVYTKVEEVDNYSRIYQSDLCGWIGQVGFNKPSIYGANVYTALGDEEIKATGFYATGKNTSYEVYAVENFEDADSLTFDNLVASGTFKNAGYYTVPFDKSINVKAGQKFAVIVRLETPGATNPLAVEYNAGDSTANVSISDGESYISYAGTYWENIVESKECNLCIKAYSDREKQ